VIGTKYAKLLSEGELLESIELFDALEAATIDAIELLSLIDGGNPIFIPPI
jgi:hypothetical protein